MTTKEDSKPDMDMFSFWIKPAMEFWHQMTSTMASDSSSTTPEKDYIKQTQRTIRTGTKLAESLLATFWDADNIGNLLKGMDTVPQFAMNMAQQTVDGFIEIQKQITDRVSRIGAQTQAYSFDDIDRDFFQFLRETYEKEFQKILQVPPLGLTRFYQERANRVIDKYNLFQTALSEFIYMFYIPIEKSFNVMQDKMDELVEKGQLHDNFKDYYQMWIKILEGHYMTLLQSPEYAQVLDNTIQALAEYRKAREEMLYDVLKQLPIPTNKEMDALYKEFYELKKQVRQMQTRIQEMEAN